MILQDFSIVFFFEGGNRGVFVIASDFKSFILKLDMEMSMDYTWPFCPRL